MSTRSAFLILTFILGAAVVLAISASGGCTKEQRSAGTHAVIDCAKVEAGPLLVQLAQLAAIAVQSQHIPWQALEDAAFRAGKEVGGCAYLALTRAVSTSAAPSILPDTGAVEGAASLARLSARFGGVEWR